MKISPVSKLTTSLCLAASLLVVGALRYAERFYPSTASANSHAENHVHEVASQSSGQSHYLNAFAPSASQSIQSMRYQEVVAATQRFLSLLDEEQRKTVLLPFDHPYRTRAFCYVLARCSEDYVGLRMSDLNTTQKIALNNVLMKSVSSAGYARAIQTMNNEGLIEEMEDAHRANPDKYQVVGSPNVAVWTPPPARPGSNYYVAIFGEPAATNTMAARPWGVRFEGHHLTLNLTFDGRGDNPSVGIMPMFFGSSPMIVPQSPSPEEGEYVRWQTQEGQQMLHRETWLARSFLKSLDASAIEQGAWSALPDVDLKGGADVPLDAASYLAGEKPGIAVAELNPLQQRLLWDFVDEFAQLQANQDIDEEGLKRSIAAARVWWFGDRDNEHGELYVRVQSDRYLIELLQSNTFGVVSSDVAANHVHASFRDLTHDWDYDSLGEHLSQHHVSLTTP